MFRPWIAGTAALACLAGPVVTHQAMAQQKTVKIGFISSFSGPVAVIGNDMRNSFELSRARPRGPQARRTTSRSHL